MIWRYEILGYYEACENYEPYPEYSLRKLSLIIADVENPKKNTMTKHLTFTKYIAAIFITIDKGMVEK